MSSRFLEAVEHVLKLIDRDEEVSKALHPLSRRTEKNLRGENVYPRERRLLEAFAIRRETRLSFDVLAQQVWSRAHCKAPKDEETRNKALYGIRGGLNKKLAEFWLWESAGWNLVDQIGFALQIDILHGERFGLKAWRRETLLEEMEGDREKWLLREGSREELLKKVEKLLLRDEEEIFRTPGEPVGSRTEVGGPEVTAEVKPGEHESPRSKLWGRWFAMGIAAVLAASGIVYWVTHSRSHFEFGRGAFNEQMVGWFEGHRSVVCGDREEGNCWSLLGAGGFEDFLLEKADAEVLWCLKALANNEQKSRLYDPEVNRFIVLPLEIQEGEVKRIKEGCGSRGAYETSSDLLRALVERAQGQDCREVYGACLASLKFGELVGWGSNR